MKKRKEEKCEFIIVNRHGLCWVRLGKKCAFVIAQKGTLLLTYTEKAAKMIVARMLASPGFRNAGVRYIHISEFHNIRLSGMPVKSQSN